MTTSQASLRQSLHSAQRYRSWHRTGSHLRSLASLDAMKLKARNSEPSSQHHKGKGSRGTRLYQRCPTMVGYDPDEEFD